MDGYTFSFWRFLGWVGLGIVTLGVYWAFWAWRIAERVHEQAIADLGLTSPTAIPGIDDQ